MDLREIKAIIDLMKKNSILEFELEQQDFKIRMRRGANGGPATGHNEDGGGAMPAITNQGAPNSASSGATNPPAALPATGEAEIKSPMIGTFYRAPSPESANYIEVGAEVNPDTIVCIIEAMKVMNEIKAEVRGVITQALVDNAKPVEFGQPMFKIRPL